MPVHYYEREDMELYTARQLINLLRNQVQIRQKIIAYQWGLIAAQWTLIAGLWLLRLWHG